MLEVKRVMPWILLEREKVAGETAARCFMVTVLAAFILGQAVRPCKKQTTYWGREWISAETHHDARLLSDKSLDIGMQLLLICGVYISARVSDMI
jgi:hypothetical protein